MRVEHIFDYFGPTVICPVKIRDRNKNEIWSHKFGDKRPDTDIMGLYVVRIDIDKTDKDNPLLELTVTE